MGDNGVETGKSKSSFSVEEILEQIDSIEIDGLSVDDKVRLYKRLLKKLGVDSNFNVQTLGGSQMIGNTIQINICDHTAMSDIVTTLVDKLGKEAVIELISVVLDKI